ncbi:hypothetical protein [Kaistia terrae]|uniref:Uncharacterized protein n=1 Tax=Kaistia terrae TaxID=537017 RepID=A0ABW0PTF5_9HYPH|nr:hypothetical protein [Kaistia terrae]MCX5577244.1 hypothetical protein [Kaistia terrae]
MTTNILPALTAATTDTEMLALLKSPESAMGFAIEHIEDFEVRQFLIDWTSGADLTPWVDAWRIDQEAGQGAPRHV